MGKYERIGRKIGKLVDVKNRAYGDAFNKTAEFFRILYPDGIKPEEYSDALALVRIFDKMMRIATAKEALKEDPYSDIAGYGILKAKEERNGKNGKRKRTGRTQKSAR